MPTEASVAAAVGSNAAQLGSLMELMKRYVEKERETEELRKALGRKRAWTLLKHWFQAEWSRPWLRLVNLHRSHNQHHQEIEAPVSTVVGQIIG